MNAPFAFPPASALDTKFVIQTLPNARGTRGTSR